MNLSEFTRISPGNNTNSDKNDFIHSEIKGEDIITEEIALMENLVSINANILDIGCGTGRHLIPLIQKNYKVTGLDVSEGMISTLRNKLSKLNLNNSKIILDDFLTYDFINEKFDLIILMWNSINEIALSTEALKFFFTKVKLVMNKGAKILINIDDTSKIDIENIDHELTVRYGDQLYKSRWTVEDFDKSQNITQSREEVFVYSKSADLITSSEGLVIQKWWGREEIETIASNFGISFETNNIMGNDELYLVGTLI